MNIRTIGAVIYTRVSTGEQDKHGTSLESQRDACRAKALALGLPIIAEHEDAGVSGGFLEARPGMQLALADIKAGRADTLICANLSRYSRKVEHQQSIKREIEAAGGHLVFCDMTFEDTPEGDLNLTIQGGFAEYEKAVIKKRTMDGKDRRVAEGKQPARGMRPFGYHIVTKLDVLRELYPAGAEGTYIINEEEATWAREIFHRYAAGTSLRGISLWLRNAGVAPIRGGAFWHPNTLTGILANPLYKGMATWGKRRRIVDETRISRGYKRIAYSPKLPQEQWRYLPAPALVEESTWNACQGRLQDNKTRLSGNNQRRHALTGLLKCPVCGRNMRSKKTRQYVHFHCRDYSVKCHYGAAVCHPKHYNAAQLEQMAALGLRRLSECPELLDIAFQAYTQETQGRDMSEERAVVEGKIAQVQEKEKAVVKAQVQGVMAGANVSAYDSIFADIARELASLNEQLSALRVEEACTPSLCSEEDIRREVLADVAQLEEILTSPLLPMEEKNALLATVVECLVPEEGRLEIVLKAPLSLGCDTVRFIVMRRSGNSSPVFLIALRTRSRDSCTAASGKPTIVNIGTLEEISTSTRTTYASIPRIALDSTWANIDEFLPGF